MCSYNYNPEAQSRTQGLITVCVWMSLSRVWIKLLLKFPCSFDKSWALF